MMQQELTTHGHINADGLLQVSVPEEWADKDVTVTLTLETEAKAASNHQPEDMQGQNLAELMKGYVGTCSFEVPEDIHQRGGEIFGDILMEKYQRRQQERQS